MTWRRCRFLPRRRTRRELRKGTPELRSRQTHQRLSDANRRVLPHVLVQREAVGGEDDDGRSVLEPAYFLAFPERRVAGDDIWSTALEAEHDVDKVQADAGDKHSRNRDQRNDVPGGAQSRPQQRALVLAEQSFNSPQRDRIDVPGVARNASHLIDAAVMRRVKTVIHARGQAQRDVAAVAMSLRQRAVAEQVRQRVETPLDLIEPGAGDRAARAHDRITRADEDFGVMVDRSRTNGCSIWLNQPMNCVTSRRGIRLVSKKLRSSCASKRRMGARSVILP